MGFLSRLAARARPVGPAGPLLLPKGMAVRRAGMLAREELPPEEAPQEEEEQVARQVLLRASQLRRNAEAPEEEGEEELARAAEEEVAEEEQPEEPLAQALRREEEELSEEAGEVRAVRRSEEVPLEEGERPLRPPFQAELEPRAMTSHPDLADQEEPSDLQALRRATLAPSLPPGPGHSFATWDEPVSPASGPGFANSVEGSSAGFPLEAAGSTLPLTPTPSGGGADRPQVIIDQLDVMIREEAPPRVAGPRAADHGRMLRARYLRRL